MFTDAQPAVKTIIHIKYSPGLVRCNQKAVFKEEFLIVLGIHRFQESLHTVTRNILWSVPATSKQFSK